MTKSDNVGSFLALWTGQSWGNNFTVSIGSTVASSKSSGRRWVTLLDSFLGFRTEGIVALNEISQGLVFNQLKKSSSINLGVPLFSNLNLGLSILSDMSVISVDLAEALGDISGSGTGKTDESD